MMTRIRATLAPIGAHVGSKPFKTFCYAVYIAYQNEDQPSMSKICLEICSITGENFNAVSKRLSRAVCDMWDHGDRNEMTKICRCNIDVKPFPRDMIAMVVQHLREEDEARKGAV